MASIFGHGIRAAIKSKHQRRCRNSYLYGEGAISSHAMRRCELLTLCAEGARARARLSGLLGYVCSTFLMLFLQTGCGLRGYETSGDIHNGSRKVWPSELYNSKSENDWNCDDGDIADWHRALLILPPSLTRVRSDSQLFLGPTAR